MNDNYTNEYLEYKKVGHVIFITVRHQYNIAHDKRVCTTIHVQLTSNSIVVVFWLTNTHV